VSLHRLHYEDTVRRALVEDFGRAGDLTSDALIPVDEQAAFEVVARQAGVIAGLAVAACAFELVDPALLVEITGRDGHRVDPGTAVLRVSGPARSILTAERTALNLLGRLSGVATTTSRFVQQVASTDARIVCTRKTTPGLRTLEKYAVRMGGGANHRFGLDDAVLIKDNHLAVVGSIPTAVERARSRVGHMVKIEVEVDDLAQLASVLDTDADIVLLDNMDVATLAEAVRLAGGRLLTEASGGISLDTVADVAATGVGLISVGAITHSPLHFDVGLDAL